MVAVLFVYLLSLVCWLGGMVFFIRGDRAGLFKVLPIAEAGKLPGRVVSALLPARLCLRRDRGHPRDLSLRDADTADVVGDRGVGADRSRSG